MPQCLAVNGGCNATAPCQRHYSRACLTTTIPAWVAPLAKVECCLRCCVKHWTRRLGLADNAAHWDRQKLDYWVSTGAGTHVGPTPATTVSADSMLYSRFSMARFAHVQAVRLADWTALIAMAASVDPGPLPPSLATPSASMANHTLIVLNGWGSGENVSEDGSRLTHRVGHGGQRFIFDDPLEFVFNHLRRGGQHAINYGNDHSISARLLQSYYKLKLGGGMFRYLAPNLDAAAAQLPYALAVPLGLNSNGRALDALLKTAAGARHAQLAHRSGQLLCCCMYPWRQRVRIVRALSRNGFACTLNDTSPSTLSWQSTMTLYLRHRFVLAVFGNGHNDHRLWEVLATGAVPVVQRFAEQDVLLQGLPVVRVEHWATFTPAMLDAEWVRIQDGVRQGTISWTKVFLPYWLHQHTEHLQPGGASNAGARVGGAATTASTSGATRTTS